jgi:hypothetical protein
MNTIARMPVVRPAQPTKPPRRATAPARLALTLGAILLLAGFLANERLIGFMYSPDGVITGTWRDRIRFAETLLIGFGATLLLARPGFDRPVLGWIRRHPNILAVVTGLAGVAGIFAAAELTFAAYNTLSARYTPRTVVSYSAPLWQTNIECRSRKTIGDRVIYDATYHRNAAGARVTPDSATEPADGRIVFFGGSFTFGQGVQDDETLPNRVAQIASGWGVTNFGYPGHGPAHMLEHLQAPGGLRGLTNGRTIVVDVFIPDHVRRTIGSMRVATTWGRQFPCYELSDSGGLLYRGTFENGRPELAPLYTLLAREPIMRALDVDLPRTIGDDDLELVARIDAESQTLVRRANPGSDFVVVLFPDHPDSEFSSKRLIPFLQHLGIRHLDYTDRFTSNEGMWIPGDGHPTPAAYAQVARWLADDLRLAHPEIATD